MKLKSAVQKGRELEYYVCDQIKEKGLDSHACPSGGSGNGTREKADISTKLMVLGRNAGFECKNYKNAHVQEWFAQAQKLEKVGREPIVAYKLFREPYGETKVILYLDSFLELLRKHETSEVRGEIVIEDSVDKKSAIYKLDYAIETLRQAKKLLKKEE